MASITSRFPRGVLLLLACTLASCSWGLETEPLVLAAMEGDLGRVEVLLSSGADVNARGSDGTTALMEAAARGHVDIVRVLLNAGAEVDWPSILGDTALTSAAANGRPEVVRVLIGAGASLEPRDHTWGETPIIRAARRNHSEVIRFLIEAGANVNAIDHNGNTALLRAWEGAHEEMVALLRQSGAKHRAEAPWLVAKWFVTSHGPLVFLGIFPIAVGVAILLKRPLVVRNYAFVIYAIWVVWFMANRTPIRGNVFHGQVIDRFSAMWLLVDSVLFGAFLVFLILAARKLAREKRWLIFGAQQEGLYQSLRDVLRSKSIPFEQIAFSFELPAGSEIALTFRDFTKVGSVAMRIKDEAIEPRAVMDGLKRALKEHPPQKSPLVGWLLIAGGIAFLAILVTIKMI